MQRQLGAASEVVPSLKYTFASPFASDAFGSCRRSLDSDILSAQSSMLSASSVSTDQQHQSQRLAGYLVGSDMEGLGSQPSHNSTVTFQAMDDAVTAVFGGSMAQLPADEEGALHSIDHVIQRRYSMGSMWPSKLRVISHDLDLSAVAAESRALYANEIGSDQRISQIAGDSWHPMGMGVCEEVGPFTIPRQNDICSNVPPLERPSMAPNAMMRRWSSQTLEAQDSLGALAEAVPGELARQHLLELAQQRQHQAQQRELLQQNQEREQRQLAEQHQEREQLHSTTPDQLLAMQGMSTTSAGQDAHAQVQYMLNMQMLNQEIPHFENLDSNRPEVSSWPPRSAGGRPPPPPPPPPPLSALMGSPGAGAGGSSSMLNYSSGRVGCMVRSPFSGMQPQFASPTHPNPRPGTPGVHAPLDIMRLMSEPSSVYNTGGGGACSQFKPPIRMGSPLRPLSRAYSGPVTPMAQPVGRAPSCLSSCKGAPGAAQPSPLTLLTQDLLTPSTGTGFFCPAIPARSVSGRRSTRPQRQRSREGGALTAAGASRPSSPPEEVNGGVGRAGGRRRRSTHQLLDPELMETFEGDVRSLTIINGLAKGDVPHCGSQSS